MEWGGVAPPWGGGAVGGLVGKKEKGKGERHILVSVCGYGSDKCRNGWVMWAVTPYLVSIIASSCWRGWMVKRMGIGPGGG